MCLHSLDTSLFMVSMFLTRGDEGSTGDLMPVAVYPPFPSKFICQATCQHCGNLVTSSLWQRWVRLKSNDFMRKFPFPILVFIFNYDGMYVCVSACVCMCMWVCACEWSTCGSQKRAPGTWKQASVSHPTLMLNSCSLWEYYMVLMAKSSL